MLRTYTAGDEVKGGFYLNRDEWTMRVAPAEGETLPGEPGTRYIALPTLAVLVAAPVLSLAFVIFLPLIGLVLMARAFADKMGLVAEETREARPADEAHDVAHK
ncbi:MAG: hypothetical protein AB7O67_21960 [Vicinamibacterales bacterium]